MQQQQKVLSMCSALPSLSSVQLSASCPSLSINGASRADDVRPHVQCLPNSRRELTAKLVP